MHTINTEDELIIVIKKAAFQRLKAFLESLDLRHENSDFIDAWRERPAEPLTGIWLMTSEEDEHLMLVVAESDAYLILKKKGDYDALFKKFLERFPL